MRSLIIVPIAALSLAACEPADRPLLDADARLEVGDGWVRPVAGADTGQVNSAAYFTIRNHSREPLVLIGARSEAAARVEVHETTLDDGVARMRPIDRVEVPAREEVVFEPRGIHLMLLDLRRDLYAGDSLSITLRFDDGSEEVAPFVVRPAAL
jgi:periplasmic copper chaperone A